MSRKKTPKGKGASAPAASALPAANGPRPALPGTARPGPGTPHNAPPQPGRPPVGSGGDFYDVAFKVMLVGDSGVGKTCLLVRFKDGAFLAGTFISTVGIDFRNKVLDVDGMKVKLQIWDTAGQERFRSVTHAYYRDAHALLLLYDVTNKASFDNIQAWLAEIQEYAQHDVVLMLLGNKVDSAQERVVKREDGEKLAKEYGLPFMETSAKTGLNVDLAFIAIAKELQQRSTKAPSGACFQLHDYVKRERRGASCCRP
ncbi:ras-related protein Rab-26 isoform X10 [Manis javanica]|uniref:ras-related protein Rab-26 isoform X10 n=1 Tax=Manis javanica TaxID=9974 RepID=UPI00187ACCF6|nr:ras-related protein Rab-26 isoform X7 [Manis javanica]KAI5932502.1 Ras-related protein Rab-26 [Manis javanica]